MTEYDYSPDAYEKYLATQARISNWVADTTRQAHNYTNPFVPRPATAASTTSSAHERRARERKVYDSSAGESSSRGSRAKTLSPSRRSASASAPQRSNTVHSSSYAHYPQQYAHVPPMPQPQPQYAYVAPPPGIVYGPYPPQPVPAPPPHRRSASAHHHHSSSSHQHSHRHSSSTTSKPRYDVRTPDGRSLPYEVFDVPRSGKIHIPAPPPGQTFVVLQQPGARPVKVDVHTSRSSSRSSPTSSASSPTSSKKSAPLLKRLLANTFDRGRTRERR